ncbi:PAS domain-containing hybrid sensor histidine kinase/response regulator [Winogradskyella sp. UBA3174]|uniref:PAS domain-containing hybrid sensor histidine kinase/response regulator n=1 Tax=Winogradskyella sp. UBA3174 TaxID=1947785 RepID=UPI0025FA925E|nr:ATP-binding protein [Winogradskyella sp. UBA3174]|tara:strand:- start:7747 stop:9477 length:1731 start_codon:yes stop_codon:yes gene_type:complete
MLDAKLHRLLRRQISNAGFDSSDIEKFKSFFENVDDAYKSFDEDVKHIEIIFEESSNELYKINKALKSKVDNVENKLNTIVNTIEGVIFQTDMAGNFKYLNKAWEELTGMPVEKALHKNYRDLLFGVNNKEKGNVSKFLREKKKNYNTLFKYYKSNGEKIWVQLRLDLTYDVQGIPTGTVGTMSDVTLLKETEIQLNQANKTKDEFLSTMSHEIRTPLNAVIGMSDILLMEKFLPEQLENLKVLKYSSEHLLALINDLLDLNKFKSEEIKIAEDDFSLSELTQNIQLHFKQIALKKDLNFETVMDSTVPAVLRGDSLKLTQVLKNLLSNAFKFTHVGSVTFQVEVIEPKINSTRIRFSVIDTGIGVSYDKQKDIFKSFVQASDKTSTLYGGSGLGLYISKELLKIQKSNLKLESNVGEGSKFWFDISFKHSNQELINTQSYVSNTEPIDLKVLVAEDNTLNALLLGKLFKKWNVDYVIAKNGEELLDVFSMTDFNLILMDLQMPILDGYDTTRVIRKMKDSCKSMIPIVALTAFSESEVGDKIKRYKMNGYLSKPFNVNELHKLLTFYSKKKQQVI